MIEVGIPYEVVRDRYDEIVTWLQTNVTTEWGFEEEETMVYDSDRGILYVAFSFADPDHATLFKLTWCGE